MKKCKHDNLTQDDIVMASKPHWKFQKCFTCSKEIGKWKIPVHVWEEMMIALIQKIRTSNKKKP